MVMIKREQRPRPRRIFLYLGSIKFSYTDEPVLEDDNQWAVWNKGKLSRSLPLFAHIGLLTREPVAE